MLLRVWANVVANRCMNNKSVILWSQFCLSSAWLESSMRLSLNFIGYLLGTSKGLSLGVWWLAKVSHFQVILASVLGEYCEVLWFYMREIIILYIVMHSRVYRVIVQILGCFDEFLGESWRCAKMDFWKITSARIVQEGIERALVCSVLEKLWESRALVS